MLVGKRVLVRWHHWYIVSGKVLAAALYTSNILFLSEAWKAVRTCSPWEVHTKSPSCDQMHTGGLWAFLVSVGHMDARAPKCSTGSVRCTYGHYTAPCGWRTCLETLKWSICGALRSPQAACMRPVIFPSRSIGSNRPRKEHIRGPLGCLRSFTGLWLEDVIFMCPRHFNGVYEANATVKVKR